MDQYCFSFAALPNFAEENFLVSECNNAAFQHILRWPQWGASRFSALTLLSGPSGSGKSHLAHIWQQQSQAHYISSSSGLLNMLEAPIPLLPSDARRQAFILENLEISPDIEELLLHAINHVVEQQHFMLITMRQPLGTIAPEASIKLPDLASRLKALPAFSIQSPDENLLRMILVKQLTDRQLRITSDVIDYIMLRIDRSFSAIHQFTRQLDEATMQEKRGITIPFLKKALGL